MRLLHFDESGNLGFTKYLTDKIPPYAILSHTWGADDDEVTFNDVQTGVGKSKAGYSKVEFCARQAKKDRLDHVWVDTCCINKANYTELDEAIRSMFRWYQNAERCYVYLSDVTAGPRDDHQTLPHWRSTFGKSRWFSRGWTLQELLAPDEVIFFSADYECLGTKYQLGDWIYDTTGIPVTALRGIPLSSFSVDERLKWAKKRETRRIEDKAYSLFGIFGVLLPVMYGEGDNAFRRLKEEIGSK